MPNQELSRLTSDLIEITSKSFLDISQVNTNFPAGDNKIKFTPEMLELITDCELQNRLLMYLNYKKSNLETGSTSGFINTPHPIGNLGATHGVVLDFIARVHFVELRIELNKDPKSSNHDKYYHYKGASNTDGYRLHQLEKIGSALKETGIFLGNDIDKCKNLESLHQLLCKKFIEEGLDVKVINRGTQAEDARLKTSYLEQSQEHDLNRVGREFVGIENKDWVGVDADGDPENNMRSFFFDSLGVEIKGQLLHQVYVKTQEKRSNSEDKKVVYEPRISCKTKRGVTGIDSGLKDIYDEVTGVDDIINEGSFDDHYESFKNKTLEHEKYPYEPREGDHFVNSSLDVILRATLPNFTNAKGLVLSDFPQEHGERLVSRLLFIKLAVDRFLSEKELAQGREFVKKPQIFLPLCENEKAINSLKDLMVGIFNKIEAKASAIIQKNQGDIKTREELEKLKALFSTDGQFVFGAFFGPSDLTADMGAMSQAVINNKMFELTKEYSAFQTRFGKITKESVTFNDVSLSQEYGKGSSPDRGGNAAMRAERTTVQGQSPSSTNTNLQKIYRKSVSQDASFVEVPDRVLKQSTVNHRHFINNDKDELGLIGKEYNALTESDKGKKMLYALTKDFSNNQGTRGKSGIVRFENQRAIGLATLRCYFGLLKTPALPYDFNTGKMSEWKQEEFEAFINHPVGLNIMITELFQYCVMDFDRAKALGFSDDLISKNQSYLQVGLDFLAQKIGLKLELTNSKEDVIDRVTQITRQLQKTDLVKDNYLKQRLELFEQQIPIVVNVSNKLTQKVCDLTKQVESEDKDINRINEDSSIEPTISYKRKQDYGTIGMCLNALSNFQLPVMSASIPKTAVKAVSGDRAVESSVVRISKL